MNIRRLALEMLGCGLLGLALLLALLASIGPAPTPDPTYTPPPYLDSGRL